MHFLAKFVQLQLNQGFSAFKAYLPRSLPCSIHSSSNETISALCFEHFYFRNLNFEVVFQCIMAAICNQMKQC